MNGPYDFLTTPYLKDYQGSSKKNLMNKYDAQHHRDIDMSMDPDDLSEDDFQDQGSKKVQISASSTSKADAIKAT